MQSAKTIFNKVGVAAGIFGLVLAGSIIPLSQTYAQVVMPAVAINESPGSVCSGQAVHLSWSSTDATSINITGVGSVSPYGDTTVYPTQTTTYTITGSNSTGGSASAYAIATVSSCGSSTPTPAPTPAPTPSPTPSPTPTPYYYPPTNYAGSNYIYNTYTPSITYPDNTHNYDYNHNYDNSNYSNRNDAPEVTTRDATNLSTTSATLNGRVVGNGTSTHAWFEYGTSRNSFSNSTRNESVGSGTTTFNARLTGLRNNTIYYFRAVAENSDGSDFGSTLSFRTDGNGGGNNCDNFYNNNYNNNNYNYNNSYNDNCNGDMSVPVANTLTATSVTTTSAQLNSQILTAGDGFTNTWFEWGTSANLGNTTNHVAIGFQTSYNGQTVITGLAPNVTYYFRAVAENSVWRNNGAVLSFVTGGLSYSTPITPSRTIRNPAPTPAPEPEGSVLGASILGANFLPGNIFGWLLLIILILIALILAKRLINQNTRTNYNVNQNLPPPPTSPFQH